MYEIWIYYLLSEICFTWWKCLGFNNKKLYFLV